MPQYFLGRGVGKSVEAEHLQHVGHPLLRFGQQEQEAASRLHQGGGSVDVVPGKVVQQALHTHLSSGAAFLEAAPVHRPADAP